MEPTKLMKLTYCDPQNGICLTGYADVVVWDSASGQSPALAALRFGGYPEVVCGLADAIYGGAAIEIEGEVRLTLQAKEKGYRRILDHDGTYAQATILAEDDGQDAVDTPSGRESKQDQPSQQKPPLRSTYIFCTPGDRAELFRAVDQKTAIPLIPEFQEYVLEELIRRDILHPLQVKSVSQKLEAWILRCSIGDKNIAEVLEKGLKSGALSIPGTVPGPSPLDSLNSVTDYLNTFGVTVAERIKGLFTPLFDPAKEPLSQEVREINRYIQAYAGYSLYDAQLAVAESIKRQLQRSKVGLIVAECGSGKSKLGAAAIAAATAGLRAHQQGGRRHKTFNLVLCPSHVAKKWVREIEETLPDTFASVVRSITEFDRLYQLYERGTKSCYAILSKENARDGYMHAPAVVWRRWNREGLRIDRDPPLHEGAAEDIPPELPVFCCPDCGAAIMQDGKDRCHIPANSRFFRREHRKNHKCAVCGAPLWTALNPDQWRRQVTWGKIGGYGFIYRPLAYEHLSHVNSAAAKDALLRLMDYPDTPFPAKGATRSYPLSSYIKRKYKGRIYGLIVDELHQYNNKSGQGEAMAELFGTAKKVVGMTATLINGYSSGIFHLLYRVVPHLMERDGMDYRAPSKFDEGYGVLQNIYREEDPEYSVNRRTLRTKVSARLLPGVSPLVYSRFLLEHTAFLSLSDMGKDLPEYEEIPVPLSMPAPVEREYKRLEALLQQTLKEDRAVARKILSAYLNLLTAYPDQPYGHKPILCPESDCPLVEPADVLAPDVNRPKDEMVLNITAQKLAAGERVIIYTNWTRLDTQERLQRLLCERGWHTVILPAKVRTDEREAWVESHLANGLQVLIANPSLIETGLDLNAFTTLIFYDIGYKLFTLRQASRRSWRINQTAPRVEVYLLYYQDTMQHKAIKLMASKLAAAGMIEGSFSEEGLAAMSECEDMTTLMARELMLGLKDSVEDVASMFKRMAVLKPPQAAAGPALPEAPPVETVHPAEPAEQPPEPAAPFLAPSLELCAAVTFQKRRRSKSAPGITEDQILLFQIA